MNELSSSVLNRRLLLQRAACGGRDRVVGRDRSDRHVAVVGKRNRVDRFDDRAGDVKCDRCDDDYRDQ